MRNVNWSNWRQFVVKSDNKTRKKVFDEFLGKTKYITPIIEKNAETYKIACDKFGIDVLEPYLFQHGITKNKLKDVIEYLGSKLKKSFMKKFDYYSNELNGKEGEYYDDFYYFRNAIFENLKISRKFDIVRSVSDRMRILGFNTEKIYVDSDDRKGKYSSPFCYAIKIPDDIRVSFKAENFLNDMNSVYHEFGHAVHFSNINKTLPFWEKYPCSEALCETFSTFFENLVSDYGYLTKELKFNTKDAEEIVERSRFLDLFAITFYSANSMFKINFWDKNMTMDKANEYYSKMIKRYMGIEVDGRYWQLHHILPESVLYVPSYLLAMIRASELKRKLTLDYGYEWYNDMRSGSWINNLIVDGTNSPIASFGDVNPKFLLDELLNDELG